MTGTETSRQTWTLVFFFFYSSPTSMVIGSLLFCLIASISLSTSTLMLSAISFRISLWVVGRKDTNIRKERLRWDQDEKKHSLWELGRGVTERIIPDRFQIVIETMHVIREPEGWCVLEHGLKLLHCLGYIWSGWLVPRHLKYKS